LSPRPVNTRSYDLFAAPVSGKLSPRTPSFPSRYIRLIYANGRETRKIGDKFIGELIRAADRLIMKNKIEDLPGRIGT